MQQQREKDMNKIDKNNTEHGTTDSPITLKEIPTFFFHFHTDAITFPFHLSK